MTTTTTAAQLAADYVGRFNRELHERVSGLLAQYPDVVAPNFLYWEFCWETSCDTSDGLRRLLAELDTVSNEGR